MTLGVIPSLQHEKISAVTNLLLELHRQTCGVFS